MTKLSNKLTLKGHERNWLWRGKCYISIVAVATQLHPSVKYPGAERFYRVNFVVCQRASINLTF